MYMLAPSDTVHSSSCYFYGWPNHSCPKAVAVKCFSGQWDNRTWKCVLKRDILHVKLAKNPPGAVVAHMMTARGLWLGGGQLEICTSARDIRGASRPSSSTETFQGVQEPSQELYLIIVVSLLSSLAPQKSTKSLFKLLIASWSCTRLAVAPFCAQLQSHSKEALGSTGIRARVRLFLWSVSETEGMREQNKRHKLCWFFKNELHTEVEINNHKALTNTQNVYFGKMS